MNADKHGRRNRYFVCLSYEEGCEEWNLDAEVESNVPRFYRPVLQKVEERLRDQGLTFYLTWKLDVLPSYGDNVIALVMGDEWSRRPLYAEDILATFKCYGDSPFLGVRRWRPLTRKKLMLLLRHGRSLASRTPGVVHGIKRKSPGRARMGPLSPVVPIPLGYGNQVELPVKPFSERGTDVFFAGSVQHALRSGISVRRMFPSPKLLARQSMLAALERIRKSRNDLRVRTATTSAFTLNDLHYGTGNHEEILGMQAYSEAMMDAKICLVPRGTSPETYRYFEALRVGAIPIVEPQPPFPFYDGAPVVELEDWRLLDDVVSALLSDTARMEELHHAGLAWWRDHCSEEAIARTICEGIETSRQRREAATKRVGHFPALRN